MMKKVLIALCQCPKRAYFISALVWVKFVRTASMLCQCPKRAYFISAVPSENPHKHWFSNPSFASILLNILIFSLF